MKTKIEIKSIFGELLFTYEAENATIKDAVEQAVKEKVSLCLANLRLANLSSADLSSADLRLANLRLANLSSANLSSADLSSADLSSADLSSADLRSANLSSANLRLAELSSADLRLVKNKEEANLPIYCKWSHSIIADKIQIGCKTKTIEDWDSFFISNKVYSTERNTDDFKQIQAVYEAYKAYLNFLSLC
jgi:multidrug efflux pump subunit AcrA (membrane-fusion protein)